MPVFLAFAVLAFWTALGWSVLRVLGVRMDRAHRLLISPLFGVTLVLLGTFWLNVCGLPVLAFARWLTLALLLAAAAGFRLWPIRSTRAVLVVCAITAVSILAAGAPAFFYGFDWIANVNDDWANYNLAAIRFINSGYFTFPDPEKLKAGLDYPGYYWFFHVAGSSRPGSELLLAWLGALLGTSPFFIFMSLILAFHGTMLMAATAFAMGRGPIRPALVAGLLLTALSPLVIYPILQQLIAQVLGLAYLAGLGTLTFAYAHRLNHWGTAIAAGILAAGFCIAYPELLPFFGLAFLLFHGARAIGGANIVLKQMRSVLAVAVVALLLAAPYIPGLIIFLLGQLNEGATQGRVGGISIFPYFVVPSGLATLWGFTGIGFDPGEPWLSVSIILGLVLFLVAIISIVAGVRQLFAPAFPLGVMVCICPFLLRTNNDFGLFKLAMFAQPFLWFSLSRFEWHRIAVPHARSGAACALLLATLPTSIKYVAASSGEPKFGFSHLPEASRHKLLSNALAQPSTSCNIDFATAQIPLIKILAGLPGCQRHFGSRDAFAPIADYSKQQFQRLPPRYNPILGPLKVAEFAERHSQSVHAATVDLDFPTKTGSIAAIAPAPPNTVEQIALNLNPEVFNEARDIQYKFAQPNSSANALIFLDSNLGSHYYLNATPSVAFYGTESDWFFKGRPIAALGRYLVFRVNKPSSSVRMVLSVTSTLKGDGANELPPAMLAGASATTLGVIGRGSARVVSPPLSPLSVGGASYLLLDLGSDARLLPIRRSGLMALYGRNIPLDYRRFVTWGRNISLVDNASFDPADKPNALRTFPRDLADARLEYSGIYEDGWLSEQGFVVLKGAEGARHMVITGTLPQGIGLDKVTLRLQVNDGPQLLQALTPGNFEISVPSGTGRQRLDFQFDAVGRLPGKDGRPVSALLKTVVMQ